MPRESAVIGLPGDVENVVRLDADHSNMCRYDTREEADRDMYELVAFDLGRLYENAVQAQIAVSNDAALGSVLPSVPAHQPGYPST